MKAGVGIDPGLGLSRAQQRILVQESAQLGFDSLWTPAGLTGRSIFHTCREWWEATREVVPGGLTVGTSVIPVPGWSVPPLAAESATLSDITGGKFKLGIGLGSYPTESTRMLLGLPLVSSIDLTRDFLSPLRTLFAGESVDYDGAVVHLHGLKLGISAPPVPVYLAALGPRMLRLAGALANGVTPNWSSPEQIVWMRERVSEGARAAGRDPAEVPFAQYIRVCVDEDVEAARRAFATHVLRYAMARPGEAKTLGYRGHFGRMGFEEILLELEARRDAGSDVPDLVDDVPIELLHKVGYFGPAAGAAAALERLAQGLDEAMVRIISVRPGDLEASLNTVRACAPAGWARG
ncbi:MAG TPA: LLM class flavin-dependent oxidoreductase [Chloroflexota bacterium]|jgi:alkanesulfonate monooxygenase SsuD/methylene tetrahydromethanopterin reductase-like flavin-dependent oxidoreductase (luciferase family)